MTDRAHPAAMNESDLWLDFYRRRIGPNYTNRTFAKGAIDAHEAIEKSCDFEEAAELADVDLEEFRKRYPHRVHDDKEGAE